MAKHYGVSVDWQGDNARFRGSVKGIDFDANVTVNDTSIDAGTDPGLLVRAVATAYRRRRSCPDYLDPSKSVEESRDGLGEPGARRQQQFGLFRSAVQSARFSPDDAAWIWKGLAVLSPIQ